MGYVHKSLIKSETQFKELSVSFVLIDLYYDATNIICFH